MKTILMVGFLLASLSVLADDSARQSCIKDAQTVKNSDLAACEKKTGNERSSCRDKAQQDYLQASKRCDEKYPVGGKK
jgi:hypothetical protein